MNILTKIKNKLIKLRVESREETPAEKANRAALVAAIKKIHDRNLPVKTAWDRNKEGLRLYILQNDPRNFLRWAPVTGSMFFGNKYEIGELQKSNWEKWSAVINETPVGNPKRDSYYKKSSINLIHTAYNLSRLVDKYHIDLKNINSIVEFGAGYGCMAKMVHDLGFHGTYTIFDIAEYLALQKYYLASTETKGNFVFAERVEDVLIKNPDIFIATWSLSEAPLDLRAAFLEKLGSPKYILIAHQTSFEGNDNIQYFKQYAKDRSDYEWEHYELANMPGNYYLIGKKK